MNDLEKLGQELFSNYGWLFVTGFIALLFKDLIHNTVEGFMIWIGNDLNGDDVVYLGSDDRPARVVRMGLRKTIFYMKNKEGDDVKLIVPNDRLKNLTIKKKLPINGTKLKN